MWVMIYGIKWLLAKFHNLIQYMATPDQLQLDYEFLKQHQIKMKAELYPQHITKEERP
jgi:hypothetical protein